MSKINENLFEFDFRNPVSKSIKKWNKDGFSLEQAEEWDSNGFTLEGAIEFNNKGLSPIEAKEEMISFLRDGYNENLKNIRIVLPSGTYTKKMLRAFIKKEFYSKFL